MLSTGTVPTGRPYSLGEEIANSITHGAGLVGAIAGSAIMLFVVAQQHDSLWFAADAVYCMSLILLYAASTFYHAIPNRRAKPIFRVMDHAAIYVLIAGTYTPFALLNLRGVWGWWLCGAVWVLAIIGVIVFTGLTAWETQSLKYMYREGDTEANAKQAILGALDGIDLRSD